MRFTTQKYTTTFARANASLKEQMSESSTAITKQMTGKKGSYQIDSSTRRNNSVTAIILNKDTVEYEGETYFVTPGKGRVNVKIKDYYFLVKHSHAPAELMQTIKPLLSNSRAEWARQTAYWIATLWF